MSSISQTLGEPTQKRRKIRKGTFSCWECKNRKIRCQFTSSSATVCAFCQRKGLSCISQECPSPQDAGYQAVERRITHVEGLVAQLVQQQGAHSPSQISPVSQEVKKDLFVDTIDPRVLHLPKAGNDATLKSGPMSPGSLSYVQSLLPSAAILKQILDRSPLCVRPFHLLVCSTAPAQVDHQSSSESNHPVHLAQRIIQLALCLQQSTQKVPELRFDQPNYQMARYFVGVASRYVTSQDLLVDSLDGVETLILEAHYHIRIGSLRDAWILFRRALEIARLLGLSCRKHEDDNRAESLWFRLVYSDRFLSLMLGLPFVDVDCQLIGTRQLAADRWSDRLERIHVVVVGRIIARNLRMQERHGRQHEIHEAAVNDYQETQDIDLQLKRAGRIPPVRWWVSPLLGNGIPDVSAPEQFVRILTRMHQFHLVVVLHQPYLIEHLRLESTTRRQMLARPSPNHTYSKMAVLCASREVLAHFRMFRNALQTIPYLGLVEKAFTSAMCLLLIHMHGHGLKTENVFEHQRPGDLAVIDDVIHTMEEVSSVHEDSLTQSRVKILSTLVRMENYAANGAKYLTCLEPETSEDNNTQATIEDQRISFSLPYFGRFYISHEMPPNPLNRH
ncbi:hypothetical protein N7519_000329 [Penicillium mononematosum]|uniref:uncharacterized protein n=1 Tax=Penicillium mononematosum TaxID=268346 RepID=UPI002546B30B|nr:uncharacterized protein N7519_000329 [Penicillium mononematosum]KAJ6190308.1 hypothetical protein N7519_000329 [Penicillium mononematosum]